MTDMFSDTNVIIMVGFLGPFIFAVIVRELSHFCQEVNLGRPILQALFPAFVEFMQCSDVLSNMQLTPDCR
jgi:hypothetical protein